MSRAFLFVLLLCFNIANVCAESSIWRLESKTQHFYIAGSIHFLRKTDYPLPDEFEFAYQRADTVIFETSLDDSMQDAMQELILAKGLFPEGETVDQHLSKQALQKLTDYCEKNRIPIGNLNRMKPWLISLTLTVLELMHHEINPSDGMDIYFHQKAINEHKKTGGLVSVEEHVNIISAFDDDLNDELIINELNEIKMLAAIMDELILAWRQGDSQTIDQWIGKTLRDTSPQIYKKVISDRNRLWAGIIDKHIKNKQNMLIIVGVGHLVGKDSLIKMLEEKGYQFNKFDT